MDLSNIGFFKAISAKMDWLTQRQQVVAQNIANADTPDFKALDITPFSFKQTAATAMANEVVRTNSMHLAAHGGKGGGSKVQNERKPWEVSPSSNGVVIEEQMMKSAETATDYQLITNLYRKNVGMIRAALGRSG